MVPIFIGGAGRSGTTLLASMLGRAEGTIVTPESQFKVDIGRHVGAPATFDAARALAALEDSWRFKIWDCAIPAAERERALAAAASWPDLLLWLARHYAATRGHPSAGVWIDHTPENIRFVPLLSQWFPTAHFVHIVRDGRALLASGRRLDWKRPGIAAGARWWGFIVGLGLAAEDYLPEERVTRIYYETLVAEPEPTLRYLSERVGLSFTPAMLQGNGFEVPRYTQKQHRWVGAPPNPSRLMAWQRELSPRDTEIFEAASYELLTMLGYTPLYGVAARPSTTAERLGELVQAGVRHVGVRRRWRRARAARHRPAKPT